MKQGQDPQLLNWVIFKEIQTINTVLWLFNVSWQITVLPQFKHVNRSSFHIYLKHEINMNKHQKVFNFNSGTHHFSSLSPPNSISCTLRNPSFWRALWSGQFWASVWNDTSVWRPWLFSLRSALWRAIYPVWNAPNVKPIKMVLKSTWHHSFITSECRSDHLFAVKDLL